MQRLQLGIEAYDLLPFPNSQRILLAYSIVLHQHINEPLHFLAVQNAFAQVSWHSIAGFYLTPALIV